MKQRNIILKLAISGFLILALAVSQAQDKVGTSAVPSLGIPVGPAAIAMGGAYVAYARDASALYWNPGAISQLGSSQVSFSHTEWILGTNYNWGGVVLNIGGGNAFGLQIAVLDYGEDDVTTVQSPEGTGERWDAQDMFATIGYARNFTDRFSIGGALKYINEKIYHESASGFAIDLGLLYVTDFRGMRLGMSISNFGTDMQMDGRDLLHPYDQDPDNLGNNPTIPSKLKTDQWPLPLFFRVGISMDLIRMEKNTLSFSTDAVVPSDNSTVLNIGGEYNFYDLFFLRGGYQSLGRQNTQEGLTAGLGLKYFVPGLAEIRLDYAFIDYGILGEFHNFGFSFAF
jgi:hypothetical protein